ncbi:NADP-specific glutamate dehydrogenase [Hyphococcus lacteus]|uniref:Glutamate dehydrogenase n=1 Tax=Hyphococcus lacteus TaxID=3143536 RepID=A0ABV3Z628_9PROT
MFWRKKPDVSAATSPTVPTEKAQQNMASSLSTSPLSPGSNLSFAVGGGSGPNVVREIDNFMDGLIRRNPHEPEFHQAVFEFAETVMPFYMDHQKYRSARILERMTEPDRIVSFRIVWEDDQGVPHANRGYRVQFNSSMGPYKGGLRFDPSVNASILKFLGFEQTFKNALTRLPMGGGKGGANFNPKGRSDAEIMRFCHAMMSELFRHIGESVDVPAGDIGVGAREIGFLFGKYKQLANHYTGGVLTGKGLSFGGSEIRKEATGYGVVVFAEDMLNKHGKSMKGKTVAISGSGNVAIYAVQRAMRMGAKVVTVSDSRGFAHIPDGINDDSFAILQDVKENRRASLSEFAKEARGVTYHAGKSPWSVPCVVGLPCATQNEVDETMASLMVKNGIECLAEGANMPLTAQAIHVLKDAGVIFGPAKAANAGGVGCSGLEQAQNAQRLIWNREQVEQELERIMRSIHEQCVSYAPVKNGVVDYQAGANIASFARVADSMVGYGYL